MNWKKVTADESLQWRMNHDLTIVKFGKGKPQDCCRYNHARGCFELLDDRDTWIIHTFPGDPMWDYFIPDYTQNENGIESVWKPLTQDKSTWPMDNTLCWIELYSEGVLDEPMKAIVHNELKFSELGTGGSLYAEATHGLHQVCRWAYAKPPMADDNNLNEFNAREWIESLPSHIRVSMNREVIMVKIHGAHVAEFCEEGNIDKNLKNAKIFINAFI